MTDLHLASIAFAATMALIAFVCWQEPRKWQSVK